MIKQNFHTIIPFFKYKSYGAKAMQKQNKFYFIYDLQKSELGNKIRNIIPFMKILFIS